MSENPYSVDSLPPSPKDNAPKQDGELTPKVIPYRNPQALIAYYLGLFSGLPLIGLPLGIVAFVLGILGLQARKRDPSIHGTAHAWIGIGCGGFFTLFWLAIIAIATFGAFVS